MDLCGFGAGAGEGVAVPWGRQGQGRMLDALWVVQLVVRNAAWHAKRKPPSSSSSFALPTRLSSRHREHHRAVAVPVPVPVVLVVFVVVLLRLNSNRLLMPTILTNVGQTSIDARGVQK